MLHDFQQQGTQKDILSVLNSYSLICYKFVDFLLCERNTVEQQDFVLDQKVYCSIRHSYAHTLLRGISFQKDLNCFILNKVSCVQTTFCIDFSDRWKLRCKKVLQQRKLFSLQTGKAQVQGYILWCTYWHLRLQERQISECKCDIEYIRSECNYFILCTVVNLKDLRGRISYQYAVKLLQVLC